MGFSHIHCPGSQVCAFEVIPTVPYYYEPSCHAGMLGCKADGVHDECRFCGDWPFESVRCPRSHDEDAEVCRGCLFHDGCDEGAEMDRASCELDGGWWEGEDELL